MDTILVDHRQYAVNYIDDVIIHSRTPEEHLLHLEKVLQAFREAQLFLKFSKTSFWLDEINFLGYTVNGQGIKPNMAKVQALQNLIQDNLQEGVHSKVPVYHYYTK